MFELRDRGQGVVVRGAIKFESEARWSAASDYLTDSVNFVILDQIDRVYSGEFIHASDYEGSFCRDGND
jgi:hypothetical protein